MIAYLTLDSLAVRILVVIIVLGCALALYRQGHDLATALLLSAVVLGAVSDMATRISPRGAN